MNKSTVLMAAILAAATVLAAGLAVLPNSVQDAQANPCATDLQTDEGTASSSLTTDERECNLIGNIDLD
jgi:hypothetical protein